MNVTRNLSIYNKYLFFIADAWENSVNSSAKPKNSSNDNAFNCAILHLHPKWFDVPGCRLALLYRKKVAFAASIYLNFFTHHFWIDVRWWLSALVLVVFWRTWVTYEVGSRRYRMPFALSFVLIGFFIWIAENVATFFRAWEYPNQSGAWRLVHFGKVSSWLLLVIVGFLIVAALKQVKKQRPAAEQESRASFLRG